MVQCCRIKITSRYDDRLRLTESRPRPSLPPLLQIAPLYGGGSFMAWWRFGKDKAPEKAEPEPSPKEDLVARVYAFLSDDELQNRKLPDWLREEISRAPSVDQVAGGSGEFGRDRNNPISVDRPLGE